MLIEYLRENYKINEPIFVTDIDLPVSDTNLRQMLKVLSDKGLIERYENGIYFLKNKNRSNNTFQLTDDVVARYKYISKNDEVYGYASGYTFANKLGLTMIFNSMIEITTNKTSAKYREVKINNLKIALRKSRTTINEDNVLILQLLDLIKDADLYIDEDIINAPEIIKAYIKRNKIKRIDVDKYLPLYPEKIYRHIYEMKLYEAFL